MSNLHRYRFLAKRIGFGDVDADEIASESVLIRLENPHTKQSAFHTVIDASRRIGFGTDRRGKRNPVLFRMGCEDKEEIFISNLGAGRCNSRDISDFEQHLKMLNDRERACLVLIYVWGFNEKEIAHCFGISESRVSQIKSSAETRISRQLEKEKQREDQYVCQALSGDREGQTIIFEGLEEVLRQQKFRMERVEAGVMAKEESSEVEGYSQESFQEWLT